MQNILLFRYVSSKYFILLVAFQAITWFSVGLNVPILRQIFGFLFLSFVPGLVILKALRVNQRSFIQIVLFSVGLSIAFVMFIGLLLNWVLPFVGISAPLNTFNLVVTVSILEFFLLLTNRLRPSKNPFLFTMPKFVPSKSLLLIIFIPLCGILGALLVNYYSNNSLSIFTYIVICALFLLSTFGKISPKLYPLIIFAIAIALLFQTTLSNHYLNGGDIQFEYYVAQITKFNQYWNSSLMTTIGVGANNYNTMLSITILPTIYSTVLNLSVFLVFTIIYPLLFSLVPLALYQIFERQIGQRFSFLSVFFFISLSTFYTTMTTLARQMIAELFLVLMFFLLLEYSSRPKTNRHPRSIPIMLAVFAFGLVVSHYSTAFIALFFLLFFSLTSIRNPTQRFGRCYLLLFALITLSWDIFVSKSTPIIALVTRAEDFFSKSSNFAFSATVGIGSVQVVTQIGRAVFILSVALIAIGLLRSLLAGKDVNISKEFLALSVASTLLIVCGIAIPGFAAGLTVSRTYQLGFFFAAPFLVIGLEFIFLCVTQLKHSVAPKIRLTRLKSKRIHIFSVLISALLITYFLFQSGFVNEVTGSAPLSLSLTIDKGQFLRAGNLAQFDGFTFEEDVFGTRWLVSHTDLGQEHGLFVSALFSDEGSAFNVLTSYGLLNPMNIQILSNISKVPEGSYIYLRNLNVVYGLFEASDGNAYNITELSNTLASTNIVYSNGASEILWSPTTILP
jgi:uncharacterized membrane protein